MFHKRRQRTREAEIAAARERRDDVMWLSPQLANSARAGDRVAIALTKTREAFGVPEDRAGADRGSWLARPARSVVVKRYFDIVVSIFLVALLSPLFLLIAAAVRWDSAGPVVIAQKRNGLHKREFRVLKFRTMTVVEDGNVAVQCRKDDPRVTGVGAFLRRTSLDELPQIFNVLRGEMSLVGPRPHPIRLDRELTIHIPGYERRFAAIPGMTGLAQVRGFRGPIQSRRQIWNRISSDIEYIETRTAFGDLSILFRTISVVFPTRTLKRCRSFLSARKGVCYRVWGQPAAGRSSRSLPRA